MADPRLRRAVFFGVVVTLPVTMWAASFPGGRPRALMACSAAWGLLVLAAVLSGRSSGPPARLRGWSIWGVPVLALLSALLVATEVPLRARFALSRTAFEEQVRGTSRRLPTRIGWFDVDEISQSGDLIRFKVVEAGTRDNAGFAYVPTSATGEGPFYRYEHLAGDWYVWEEL